MIAQRQSTSLFDLTLDLAHNPDKPDERFARWCELARSNPDALLQTGWLRGLRGGTGQPNRDEPQRERPTAVPMTPLALMMAVWPMAQVEQGMGFLVEQGLLGPDPSVLDGMDWVFYRNIDPYLSDKARSGGTPYTEVWGKVAGWQYNFTGDLENRSQAGLWDVWMARPGFCRDNPEATLDDEAGFVRVCELFHQNGAPMQGLAAGLGEMLGNAFRDVRKDVRNEDLPASFRLLDQWCQHHPQRAIELADELSHPLVSGRYYTAPVSAWLETHIGELRLQSLPRATKPGKKGVRI
jgi:hypothetical protein